MLFSLALMVLCALILNGLMQKLRLPGLVGMLLTGIIMGPYVLNLIVPELLNISADLRKLALIVILTRAGLSLDIEDLKRVGRPALLMCFLPATLEIIACTLLAPMIFHVTPLEGAIMGSVLVDRSSISFTFITLSYTMDAYLIGGCIHEKKRNCRPVGRGKVRLAEDSKHQDRRGQTRSACKDPTIGC